MTRFKHLAGALGLAAAALLAACGGGGVTTGAATTESAAAVTDDRFISFGDGVAKDIGVFGGALVSVVDAPGGVTGKALRISKPGASGASALSTRTEAQAIETWGGAYMTVPRVPFTAKQMAVTAQVYSSLPNSIINLKVEEPGNGEGNLCRKCKEVAGTTVEKANTWTTVTWNFSPADLSHNYTMMAIIPDSARKPDGQIYYFRDIKVVDTPAPVASNLTLVTFDETPAAVLDPFETTFIPDVDGTNKIAKLIKGSGNQEWGGATFKTCPANTVGFTPAIPFSAASQVVTVRVKAPRVGVTFSLEARGEGANGATEVFAEATNTTTDWEVLTFDFASKTYGAAIDPSKVYNKLSIFPNFSKGQASANPPVVQLPEAADSVYLIDDVKLMGSTATLAACPAVPVSPVPTTAPPTPSHDQANVISIFSDAYTQTLGVDLNPNWGQNTVVTQPIIEKNTVLQFSNFNYQGIDFDGNRINVSPGAGFETLHVDLWASSSVTSVDVFVIDAGGEQSVNVPISASAWRSGSANLNSAISGNSGYEAGSR